MTVTPPWGPSDRHGTATEWPARRRGRRRPGGTDRTDDLPPESVVFGIPSHFQYFSPMIIMMMIPGDLTGLVRDHTPVPVPLRPRALGTA